MPSDNVDELIRIAVARIESGRFPMIPRDELDALGRISKGEDGAWNPSSVDEIAYATLERMARSNAEPQPVGGPGKPIPPFEYWDTTGAADSPEQFMAALERAAASALSSVKVSIHVTPEAPDDEVARGIFRGHVVRLYKLLDTYGLLIREGRLDVAVLLVRSLLDTVIELHYVARDADPQAAIRRYIGNPRDLRRDIAVLNEMPDEAERTRALRDTEQELERLRDYLDRVKATGGRPSAGSMANQGGIPGAYDLYDFYCSFTHGTRRDLLSFHVVPRGIAYVPQVRYMAGDPGLLLMPSMWALLGAAAYLDVLAPSRSDLADEWRQRAGWFADANVELSKVTDRPYGARPSQ